MRLDSRNTCKVKGQNSDYVRLHHVFNIESILFNSVLLCSESVLVHHSKTYHTKNNQLLITNVTCSYFFSDIH
jgi:hypothetical protein